MPPRTRNTSDIAMLTHSTIRNPSPRIVRIRATIDSGGLLFGTFRAPPSALLSQLRERLRIRLSGVGRKIV
jgi:hypothetical protein